MKKLNLLLLFFLFGCVSDDININAGDLEKSITADLTRWTHLPHATLPAPKFLKAHETGKWTIGTGTPNTPITVDRELLETNQAFSTQKVVYQTEGGKSVNYRSYISAFMMGASADTKGSDWGREVLGVEHKGALKPAEKVLNSKPVLQGVKAEDLSVEFTWKIRVNQGLSSERWFNVKSRAIDVVPVKTVVNGKGLILETYLLETEIKNIRWPYKAVGNTWYLPAIGWYAKWDSIQYYRGGNQRKNELNLIRFTVPAEMMPELEKIAVGRFDSELAKVD